MIRRGIAPLAVLLSSALLAGCACVRACPRPESAVAEPDASGLPPEVTGVAEPRAWRVIVLHHSAGAVGGAARFDEWHKAKGWDGVGYDFVIGNGTDTGDGALETTFRWREQRDGAHAKGWNDLAIGICLVGNFEETDPTPKQRETLVRLLRWLMRRFSIPKERVVGHGAVGTTACPGRRFKVAEVAREADPSGALKDSPVP